MRGTPRRTRSGRHKHALLNPVVDVAPPYAAASEGQQPDHKGRGIPNHDERHRLPEPFLLQSPHANQQRHRHAERQIRAEIREANCGWMSQRNRQTPWKCLRESKADMSPRTHVPHDGHPTEALSEKRAWRIIVRYSLHGVGKHLDLKALLRYQPADKQIIGGLVFNGLVPPKSSKVRASRNYGWSQCEFDAVQLPGDQNSGIKVGIHADGLKMLRECFVLSGNIQAGHSAHFGVAERGHHCSQVIRLDANVAVVDDKNFIASFVYHPDQFGHFIVDGVAPRAIEDSNLALGKLAHQLLEKGNGGVVFIADAENQLIIRVVLAAIAGKVFVGFRIEAADRLQVADRRSKVQVLPRTILRTPKEEPRTVQDEHVIDEGRSG